MRVSPLLAGSKSRETGTRVTTHTCENTLTSRDGESMLESQATLLYPLTKGTLMYDSNAIARETGLETEQVEAILADFGMMSTSSVPLPPPPTDRTGGPGGHL